MSHWDLGDGLDGCALALKENMRNLNKTEITVFDEILHYAKKFFKKNQLFYVFSKFHLCFTFKNTSNCLFK